MEALHQELQGRYRAQGQVLVMRRLDTRGYTVEVRTLQLLIALIVICLLTFVFQNLTAVSQMNFGVTTKNVCRKLGAVTQTTTAATTRMKVTVLRVLQVRLCHWTLIQLVASFSPNKTFFLQQITEEFPNFSSHTLYGNNNISTF